MARHLIHAVLLTALLAGTTGCQGPTAPPTRAPFAVAASSTSLETRVLVEGQFTLPASLVSVGSGSLVSVGSGNLVSVGTGQYRVQAVSGDVPVAKAMVALLGTLGQQLGIPQAPTDDAGRYRVVGAAAAGVYLVQSERNGQRFRSLAAVRDGVAAQAAIDVATTMVTARLIAAQQGQALDVLPARLFAETVALVRSAIATHGLPAGFDANQADSALMQLEAQDPAVARAMGDLQAEQARLEERYTQFQYQLQGLAVQTGIAPAAIAAEVRAVLSDNPDATDEELQQEVKKPGTRPASTATPTPTETFGTAPSAAPSTAPSAAPSAPASPAATPAPTASANGVDNEPAPTPKPAKGNGKGQGNGNGNGNGSQASPAPLPTTPPSASPSPSTAPSPGASASPAATPAPSTTPAATPSPAPSADGGKTNNGNAHGHDKDKETGNGNANPNGQDKANDASGLNGFKGNKATDE